MQPTNYNQISKIYDDVREGDIILINHFLQEIPRDDFLNILDIGCGTGNYTDLFQKVTQTKHYRVYGIELVLDRVVAWVKSEREKTPLLTPDTHWWE